MIALRRSLCTNLSQSHCAVRHGCSDDSDTEVVSRREAMEIEAAQQQQFALYTGANNDDDSSSSSSDDEELAKAEAEPANGPEWLPDGGFQLVVASGN